MKHVPLGEVTTIVKTWNPTRQPASEFSYVDLGSVDGQSKRIIGSARHSGSTAPSRARQLVACGDILVSTVRPNLNAVARIPKALHGATASTGFCVLRPSPRLSGEYLFHWVQTPAFVTHLVRRASGASYPAVSDRIIRASHIPLPSLDEQRRIAAILDQADAIRAKRRQVLAHLDSLTQSIFHDMFGGRPLCVRIDELVESTQYGSSAKASNHGAWPVLRMGNVTYDGRLDLTHLKYLDLSERDVPKYSARRGDLLFNRTNSVELVGKSCVVDTDQPLAFAGYLVRARFPRPRTSMVVSGYLNSPHGKATLRGMAKSIVGQANINAAEFRTISVPRFSVSEEDRFADRLGSLHAKRSHVQRQLCVDDELFASLQARAFRGEL